MRNLKGHQTNTKPFHTLVFLEIIGNQRLWVGAFKDLQSIKRNDIIRCEIVNELVEEGEPSEEIQLIVANFKSAPQ
ncbi:hypothetical protein CSV79_12075 [Sporosarcina sp. P13]|uniref:hypothetical protein n=1 Tax=Sporosarcina sp. P13 TaxID=2048263 RepID=UPI000C1664BD|nr:hypothetical protein [Sporosarcina sp. P13]PIC63370.1 hypothetical protein CSV79_12075 [Sporosarcina sp. P13]